MKKKNVCGATGMLESLAQQRSEEPVTPKTPCQTLKESIKVGNKTGKKKRHYPQKKPVNEVHIISRPLGLPSRKSGLTLRSHETSSSILTSTPEFRASGQRPASTCSHSAFLPSLLNNILTQSSKATSLAETSLHKRISVQHTPRHCLDKLEDLHGIRNSFDVVFARFEDG